MLMHFKASTEVWTGVVILSEAKVLVQRRRSYASLRMTNMEDQDGSNGRYLGDNQGGSD